MAEPTLSLKKSDLQAEAGFFLGYGRGTSFGDPAWTQSQLNDIQSVVNSGYRQFLYPAIGDARTTYDWSFLKPVGTFDLPSGTNVVALPDDFGAFDGQLTVANSNVNSSPWRIAWRNEGTIRELFSVNVSVTGPPMFAADNVLRSTGAQQGQRHQLLVYPASDQHYTLQCAYFLNPDALTDAFPYCLGGQQHTETTLAAVLAAAELFLDDSPGARFSYFQQRLQASIAADRKNKPQAFGYNRDASDCSDMRYRGMVHGWGPAVTYNGGSVQP